MTFVRDFLVVWGIMTMPILWGMGANLDKLNRESRNRVK